MKVKFPYSHANALILFCSPSKSGSGGIAIDCILELNSIGLHMQTRQSDNNICVFSTISIWLWAVEGALYRLNGLCSISELISCFPCLVFGGFDAHKWPADLTPVISNNSAIRSMLIESRLTFSIKMFLIRWNVVGAVTNNGDVHWHLSPNWQDIKEFALNSVASSTQHSLSNYNTSQTWRWIWKTISRPLLRTSSWCEYNSFSAFNYLLHCWNMMLDVWYICIYLLTIVFLQKEILSSIGV